MYKIPIEIVKGPYKHLVNFEEERQYFQIVYKNGWARFVLKEDSYGITGYEEIETFTQCG